MLFRVAALMRMPVERLLAEMPADEFIEWCAFYDLEPWGFQADAWRSGVVAATVANYSGRTRTRADAKPRDFMPKRKGERRQKVQSPGEIQRVLESVSKNG
jgi:hypothetical protein